MDVDANQNEMFSQGGRGGYYYDNGRGGRGRRPDAGIEGCICLRDMMRIFCESCGHADEGRLRKICPLHPKDIYLYDVTNCANCHRPHVPGRKPRLLKFPLNYKSKKKFILLPSSAH